MNFEFYSVDKINTDFLILSPLHLTTEAKTKSHFGKPFATVDNFDKRDFSIFSSVVKKNTTEAQKTSHFGKPFATIDNFDKRDFSILSSVPLRSKKINPL